MLFKFQLLQTFPILVARSHVVVPRKLCKPCKKTPNSTIEATFSHGFSTFCRPLECFQLPHSARQLTDK